MNKKTGWFLVFLEFSCFSPVICNNENQVYLRLIQNDKNILNFFNPQLSAFKELIKRVLQDGALDKECENSLISIDDGLERKEAWALKCRSLLTNSPNSICSKSYFPSVA